jgi:hypothetical protein
MTSERTKARTIGEAMGLRPLEPVVLKFFNQRELLLGLFQPGSEEARSNEDDHGRGDVGKSTPLFPLLHRNADPRYGHNGAVCLERPYRVRLGFVPRLRVRHGGHSRGCCGGAWRDGDRDVHPPVLV